MRYETRRNFIKLTTQTGKKLMIAGLSEFAFELGNCYVCRDKVIYLLQEDKEKYYKNVVCRISSLASADKRMRREMEGAAPVIHSHGKARNGMYFLVLDKPEHAAWMISRLGSMACYLNYSGLVHNGMDINSCFVSPKDHTILLGGGCGMQWGVERG